MRIDCSIEDFRQGFAEFAAGDEGSGAIGLGGSTNHLPDLLMAEDFRLRGEAKEVVVAAQQFFRSGVAEAPVEGVDEIESGMSGDEFEGVFWRCR